MRARALILLALGACSPTATPLPASHPAHVDAKPGRLAGPSAALRRGVAKPVEPAKPAPPVDHSKHESPQ